MHRIVFFCLMITLCGADLVQLFKQKGNNPTREANGIEFDAISRGSLLQILSAFEEYVNSRVGKKGKQHDLKMSTELQVNYPDPGFWTATSMIQLGYGVWINLSMVSIGLAYGFTAVTLPQLRQPDSKIEVTVDEESWITSVMPLFSPIGCVLCGYLIDKFGRRTMLIYSQLPVCLGWLFISFADSAKKLIIGRIITGIGIGMVMSVPRVYMTEICLPNMRGAIGSFPNIAISIGITLQAGLGSLLKWTVLCYIGCTYAICLFFFNIFLPETPYYLIQKDLSEDAVKSLKKFRGKKYNIRTEMDDLIDFKNDNEIRRLNFVEQLTALLRPSAYKPFCLMTVYKVIAELSGSSIVFMWTIDILERSKSSINADVGNLMLGLTRIIIGVLVAVIIFHVGRRTLALTSGLGVGVVCVTLGLLIHYEKHSTVLPQVGFMLYVMFITAGYYTLPPLIMYELYPLQVRGLLGGISLMNLNLFIFSANKCYPYIRDLLGFPYTILAFGVSSLLGCIFLYFCLPETKDLTLQEIEEYYNDRRSTLISQRRLMSMQLLNSLSKSAVSSSLPKQTDKNVHSSSK